MKLDHIISFSLYGSNPLYCEGALQNAELPIRFYREWVCRFYIDDTVPEDCVGELHDKHLLLQKRLIRRIHPLESDLAAFWVAKLQLTQEGQDRAVNLLGLTRIVRHCQKGRWPLIGWLLRLWYRNQDKRLIVRSLVTTTAGRRPAGSGEHLFSAQTSCGNSSRKG
jgi:hypothetical protein